MIDRRHNIALSRHFRRQPVQVAPVAAIAVRKQKQRMLAHFRRRIAQRRGAVKAILSPTFSGEPVAAVGYQIAILRGRELASWIFNWRKAVLAYDATLKRREKESNKGAVT